jgi:serine/threonine protein phosphatase 1
VVERARALEREAPEMVKIIKGNHEAMMVAALSPSNHEAEELTEDEAEAAALWYCNGGIETLQSYLNEEGQCAFPAEHFEFLSSLPTWHEDEHAIYVHAALPMTKDGSFLHPREAPDSPELIWARNRRFFSEYRGKTVVFGHTIAGIIFGERGKVWLRESLIGVDTGAYLTGVLSAVELPTRQVYSVSEPVSEAEDLEGVGSIKKIFGWR